MPRAVCGARAPRPTRCQRLLGLTPAGRAVLRQFHPLVDEVQRRRIDALCLKLLAYHAG